MLNELFSALLIGRMYIWIEGFILYFFTIYAKLEDTMDIYAKITPAHKGSFDVAKEEFSKSYMYYGTGRFHKEAR
jgi:hypothetical protein